MPSPMKISRGSKSIRWGRSLVVVLLVILLDMSIDQNKISGKGNHISGPSEECVVLLHGLARTERSMEKMADTLSGAGYTVFNMDYPSREKRIEQLAMEVIPESVRICREKGKGCINFVTHSMGGIVLRYYLSHNSIQELGRVVMLSPPNKGSEVADELMDNPAYYWLNGPAGLQLGTGPEGFVSGLGPVDFPLGIITGNEHSFFDAWLSQMIPGENDGKVSVERAKVEGMSDFLVLPYTHTYIMEEDEVISQTIYFLRHGKFHRDEGPPEIR